MEAIISTGNKQYIVREGETLAVEKLEGKTATFAPLLVTQDGQPVNGKSPRVSATVVEETKGEKVVVFKMQAKKRYRKKSGHRQHYSVIKIDHITA